VKHDLGTVNTGGKGEVDVEVPVEQKDINAAYEEACAELQRHVEEEVKHRSKADKQDDYYKSFRTRVVLSWILSNAGLVAGILNASETLNSFAPAEERTNNYFAFILWAVTGLAAFRFCGSCTYLLFRLFTGN
jgi:chitin synthase